MSKKQCTMENPYTPTRDEEEVGNRREHSDVREIGEQEDGYPSGDIVTKQCRNCGLTWKQELPQ